MPDKSQISFVFICRDMQKAPRMKQQRTWKRDRMQERSAKKLAGWKRFARFDDVIFDRRAILRRECRSRRHDSDVMPPLRDGIAADAARHMTFSAAAGKELPAPLQPVCICHLRRPLANYLLCGGKRTANTPGASLHQEDT